MATIDQIRAALAARLKTISSPQLRAYDRVPDTVEPPAAVVRYAGTDFDSTMMRGSDEQRYIIQVFTSKASDRGQDALLEYCDGTGARSVKAALESDPTLGGVVTDAHLTEAQEPGMASPGGVEMYSVELVVAVMP